MSNDAADDDVVFLPSHPATAQDLRAALDAAPIAIVVLDPAGTVVFANISAENLVQIEHRASLFGSMLGHALTDTNHRTKIELRTPDGVAHVEMEIAPCEWDGSPAQVIVMIDVTQREHTEARLHALKDRLEHAAAGADDALFDWDLETGDFHITDPLLALMPDQAVESHGADAWFDAVHPDDRSELEQALAEHLYGDADQVRHDHRIARADGSHRWISVRARAVFENGSAVRLSGTLADIDEQRTREDRLRHDSLHDPLTGLANRALLMDRLDHAVRRAIWEPRRRYGVLLLDLDGFKAVNDTHGHAAGDHLLVELAGRMQSAVRPADTVARLGGDEFAVLVDSFVAPIAVDTLARRLRVAVAEPVQIGRLRLGVTASIGAVISSQKPRDLTELLEQADAAMYRAKTAGGNRIEISVL